jgi:pimeloyl-ACP methyl ester carboxylesterase
MLPAPYPPAVARDRQNTALMALGGLAIGGAVAALTGLVAARSVGRRVRRCEDPRIDPLLPAPADVVHHQLPTRDGGSLHVVERGSGRPLVLLHGVTLQWWIWGAQFNTLSDRYRLIAWDMRGHGRSTAGSEGVTLDAVAHDLATVLVELDVRDAVVVGHSMGGMALARFCTDHHELLDERLGGLMFLATSAAPVALPAVVGGGVGLINLVQRIATAGMRRPRLRYRWPDTDLTAFVLRTAFGRRASGAAVDEVRRMIAEVEPETAMQAGAAIAAHDVREDLGHVDVPAMVVVGGADLLTPASHARGVAECVPDADLRVLRGIGHQVMQEAPEELEGLIDELAKRGHASPALDTAS